LDHAFRGFLWNLGTYGDLIVKELDVSDGLVKNRCRISLKSSGSMQERYKLILINSLA
jgi:hypothetical protein